jgi:hypothetical protein
VGLASERPASVVSVDRVFAWTLSGILAGMGSERGIGGGRGFWDGRRFVGRRLDLERWVEVGTGLAPTQAELAEVLISL